MQNETNNKRQETSSEYSEFLKSFPPPSSANLLPVYTADVNSFWLLPGVYKLYANEFSKHSVFKCINPIMGQDYTQIFAKLHINSKLLCESGKIYERFVHVVDNNGKGNSISVCVVGLQTVKRTNTFFAVLNVEGLLVKVDDPRLLQSVTCETCKISIDYKKVNLCGKCLTVSYCSSECQKKNWKTHKNACKNKKDDFVENSVGMFACSSSIQKEKMVWTAFRSSPVIKEGDEMAWYTLHEFLSQAKKIRDASGMYAIQEEKKYRDEVADMRRRLNDSKSHVSDIRLPDLPWTGHLFYERAYMDAMMSLFK